MADRSAARISQLSAECIRNPCVRTRPHEPFPDRRQDRSGSQASEAIEAGGRSMSAYLRSLRNFVHRSERRQVPTADIAPAAHSKIKRPPTEAASKLAKKHLGYCGIPSTMNERACVVLSRIALTSFM
jgi:hypothetical protein